jgi:hypothetical protein
MTKKQKRERGLLLLSYSFLHQLWEREGKKELELKGMTEADLIFKQVYKKLFRIRRIFADERIKDFVLKRVPDDISRTCDMSLVAVVILNWFKRLNLTKEIILTDDIEKLTKLIAQEMRNNNEDEFIKNSIEYASSLVVDVFPDKKGLIKFREMTNKFPFDLIAKVDDEVA